MKTRLSFLAVSILFMLLSFRGAAQCPVAAYAGPNATICQGASYTLSAATASNYTSLLWTTSGSGSFSNNTFLKPTYFPSATDIATGNVNLTLTATNSLCPTPTVSSTMILTINPLPSSAGAISGTALVCQGQNAVSYSVAAITNATSYTWAYSGTGATINGTTNNITINFATSATSGNLTVMGTNSCGNGTISGNYLITVNPLPAAAGIISGTASVCQGQNAVLYSVGVIANATSYTWVYTGTGATISNGTTNSISISFAANASSGNLTVMGTNSCGNGTISANYLITVNPFPAAAGTITGTSSVCQGQTAVSYSVAAITNATSYIWAYSGTGATINGTTSNITINFSASATSGNLTVMGTNSCGNGTISANYLITMNPLPSGAGTITGTASVCQGQNTVSYSVPAIANATSYTWAYSGTGATINGTTINITINFAASATSGNLTVMGTNPCGNGTISANYLITMNPLPAAAGTITGTSSVCQGQNTVSYSVPAIANATSYTWAYSGTGTTINGTTSNITINFAASATSGNLTVMGTNPCGNGIISANYLITVNHLPAASGTITGTALVCQGQNTVSYSVSAIANATSYTWAYSGTGATINGTTSNITIDFAASATSGNLTVMGTNSCGNGTISANYLITMNPLPSAAGTITGTASVCQGQNTVSYSIPAIANATSYTWAYSGTGTTINGTTSNITINFAASATSGNLTVMGTNPCGNGTISANYFITMNPLPDAAGTITGQASVCQGQSAESYLVGVITNATSYTWAYTGTGATISNGTTNNITISFSASASSGNLTVMGTNSCGNGTISANYLITVYPSPLPTAYAGLDATICEGNNHVIVGSSATNYSALNWATSGDGTFINGTTLNPTYTPGTNDKFNGVVTLTMTAYPLSPCSQNANSQMLLHIIQDPIMYAGPDATICAGITFPVVSATAQHASTITWTTSGDGTFSPSAFTLLPIYMPGSADIANGHVTLTITGSNPAPCPNSASDQMLLTIISAPLANAGSNATICENANYPITTASASSYSSLTWTTSGNGTFDNVNIITPVYTPGSDDIAAGSVNLTLTAINNPPCAGTATDFMVLTLAKMPVVYAGSDVSICEGNTYTTNSATVQYSTSLTWTSNGSGSFSNVNVLNTIYTPSVADILNGSVILTLTADATAPCTGSKADNITVTITRTPTANAGPDAPICEGSFTISGATATHYSTLLWSTFGTGTFSGNGTLTPTYTPSVADITAGSVTLTLTANPYDPPCSMPATDAMTLTILPFPTAYAGANATICEGQTHYISDANATHYSTLLWSTSGTGTFANGTTLTPTYTPSAADITAGSVILTLNATGVLPCTNTVTSQQTLTIQSLPDVIAGPAGLICQGSTFSTSGAIVENAGTTLWSTSGTGYFLNVNQLNTTYTPSALDITNGGATLTLTATSLSPCVGTVSDTRVLTITPLSTAYAGPNSTICTNTTFSVSGATATNYSSLNWTTSGTGTFTGSGTLTPTYTLSAADITIGSVTLTLTATPGAPCLIGAISSMTLTIDPIADIYAGADAYVCYPGSYTVLDATAHHYATINWTTSGSGILTNASSLTPTYATSAADVLVGSVTLIATVTSILPCVATVTDNMVLHVTPLPVVYAGPDGTTCGSNSFTITGATQSNATGVTWMTSGSGTFSNNTLLNPIYTPSASDILAGSVTLTLTGNSGTGCSTNPSDSFILTIVGPATANAGADASVCENGSYTIHDATATNYTAVNWTTTGSGILSDGGTLTPTYTPSAADILAGSVTLTLTVAAISPCTDVTNQMVLTIVPNPLVNAGPDASTCAGTNYAITLATAQNSSSVLWSTSGSGNFSNPNILHPVYTASAADITAGHVILTLEAQPNNPPCTSSPVTDSFILTFISAATANAGLDANICETNTYTISGATAGNYASLNWTTSGTGGFSSGTTLTPTYTPSAADIAAGSVILTLHATGNPPCTNVTDNMTLTITPTPLASAGASASICFGNSYTVGDATASHYSSLLWTTTGTGTLTNASTLTPTYVPSAIDLTAGSVTLTLTANANAPCIIQALSSKVLLIQAAPTANAGPDATICQPYTYTISGSTATNYLNLNWTSSGTGSFTGNGTLTPTYYPSIADFAAGLVILTLHANGISPCNTPVTDDMVLHLVSSPAAYAGLDAAICEGGSYTISGATVTNQANFYWTTTGLGTLANPTQLNPTYTAAPGETGSVTLTLTAEANPPCAANATDQMIIVIQTQPTANAGTDATICEGSTHTLSGTVTNNVSFNWTTNGSGSFANSNTLHPTYTPSAADIAAGSVIITLTSIAISPCAVNASDAMTLTLISNPVVNAGGDATICLTGGYLLSQATASHYTSILWTTSGDGTFSNSSSLNPTYNPGTTDILNGQATLTLTGQPFTPCLLPVSDNMVLHINDVPTANAGPDATACSSTYTVTGATAANYSVIAWATSGTGTFINGNTVNPTYNPSSADLNAGSVTLVMNVTGISPCTGTVSDAMVLTLPPLLTANAGSNSSVCQDVPFMVTDATAANYLTLLWTSSGTGTFINANTLNPTYAFSAIDIANGSVTLSLTANGLPPCNSTIVDDMILTIVKTSVANAGPNSSICAGSNFTVTGATATNFSTILWMTSGTGTYLNVNTINPTYIPSAVDIANGSVDLTMITYNIAPCTGNNSDIMILTINHNVTVNAGPDNAVCYPSSFTVAGASASNYQNLTWTSSGTGIFINNGTLTPTYFPSITDLSAGSVVLTLTGTGMPPCTTPAVDMMILGIDGAPGNAGTITGTTPVCQGQSGIVYSVPTIANATSYIWNIPSGATIISGNNTNIITLDFGATAVSGDITVYAMNACGNGGISAPFHVTVIQSPAAAGSITGTTPVCQGQNGVSYTVPVINNATGYLWTLPAGANIVGGANTNSITVNFSVSAIGGDITVQGTNSCGSGTISLPFTLVVNPLPSSAGTITGTTPVCQGQSGVIYSIPAIAGATGYSWTLPSGASIIAGNNTNTITVNFSFSATSGTITVTGMNACGNGTSSAPFAVTVDPLPGPAGTITGSSEVCIGQTNVSYSVLPITNATGYTWTIPVGASIVAGANTNNITVDFSASATSGTITVQGTNGCGVGLVSPPFVVTVKTLPLAPGAITGSAIVCQGQTGVTYSIVAIPNATGYNWTLPTGATIATGSNTNSITVDFSTTAISGNITVLGTNVCGAGSISAPYAVTVNPLPSAAGVITGLSIVCEGQNGVIYSVSPILNATSYNWTLPVGVIIVAGANTHVITVNFTIGAMSGDISVNGTNACGNGLSSIPFPIIVNALPYAAGIITGTTTVCQGQTGVIYSVQAIPLATGYNWTLPSGASIFAGANTSSIMVDYSSGASSGFITVQGTNACGSGTVSAPYPVTVNISPVSAYQYSNNGCVGEAVQFTDQSLQNGGGAISSWQWNFGDPASGTNNVSTLQNPTHIFISSGIHSVTLTITNINNCSNTISHTVNIYALPVADFSATPACQGTSTTFTDLSVANSTAIVTWDWDFGDGSTHSSLQNPSHTYVGAGTYNVSLIVTNSNGCIDAITKPVQVIPLPIAAFITSSANCAGAPVQFTDQSSTSYGYISKWIWDFGDGTTPVTINYPGPANILHVYSLMGIYNATLTVETSDNCSSSISHLVTVTNGPLANFIYGTNLCLGQTVQFTDQSLTNGAGPITIWQWNFGDPASGTNNTSTFPNPSHTFTTTGIHTVTLTVTNINSCMNSITLSVEIFALPMADFSADAPCQGIATTFTDLSVPNATAIVTWDWDFGDGSLHSSQQNPVHLYTNSGTYNVTLTVRNSNECMHDTTMAVMIIPKPTAQFQTDAPVCLGSIVHYTNLSTTLHGQIVRWTWDFGDGTDTTIYFPGSPDIGHLFQGVALQHSVRLTVKTSDSCENFIEHLIISIPSPVANFSYSTTTCAGQDVQFTDLSQLGGGTPISTWHWNFGDPTSGTANISNNQNPMHSFTSANTFNVMLVVTNNNFCSDTIVKTVIVNLAPVAKFTYSNNCLGTPTQFTDQSVPNASAIVAWDWNFGDLLPHSSQQNPLHLYLNPGIYNVTLTVTNTNQCVHDTTITVTIYAKPNAQFQSNAPVCLGLPVNFVNLSTTTHGYIVRWIWDFGDGTDTTIFFPGVPNVSHVFIGTALQHLVRLTVTTNDSCSDFHETTIQSLPTPVANFSYSSTLCSGQNVQFTDQTQLNGGGVLTGWYWNFNDPTSGTQNISYLQNPVHVFTSAGNYNVTLIATNIETCSNTMIKTITINPQPAADFLADTACLGTLTHFQDQSVPNASLIITWDWNFGDGTPHGNIANPIHLYTASGTYSVTLTVTNSNGCIQSRTRNVMVLPSPTASFVYSTNNCSGTPVQFTDQSTATYGYIVKWIWNFGDGTDTTVNLPASPNVSHVYASGGTYIVTLMVKTADSCTASVSHTITVTSTPLANFDYPAVRCEGMAVQFTDLSQQNGGGIIMNWEWNFGDPGTGTNNTSTLQNPFHIFSNGGTYQVQLIITNTSTCKDTIVKPVGIDNKPSVDFTFDTVCKGDVTHFTDASVANTGSITNWLWNFGDGITSNLQNPTHLYSGSGYYQVVLTVTNSAGCSHDSTKMVQVKVKPSAAFSFAETCKGSPTQFHDLSTTSYGVIDQWQWDFGDGGNSTIQNPAHTYSTSGIFNVMLIVTNSSGCSDSITLPMTINPTPTAEYSYYNTYCPAGRVDFFDQSTANNTSIVSWYWEFEPGSYSNEQNPVYNYSQTNANYPVTLIVTDGNGCKDTIVDTVYVKPAFQLAIQANDTCLGNPNQFHAINQASADPLHNFTWNFGESGSYTNTSILKDPQHTYDNPGTYFVTLKAWNSDNCVDSVYNTVTVYPGSIADFSYNPGSFCTDTTVIFTNLSSGNGTNLDSLIYTFGDGTSAIKTAPFTDPDTVGHHYSTFGTYTVTLTAINTNGCRSVKTRQVLVTCITTSFSLADTIICQNSFLVITDNSTPQSLINKWHWDFGDGLDTTYFIHCNTVKHKFQQPGSYNIKLVISTTVSGITISDSSTRQVLVKVSPRADFSSVSVCLGDGSKFIDLSDSNNVTIISHYWRFGDLLSGTSDTSTLVNPVHKYTHSGSFNPKLIIQNAVGCADSVVKSVKVHKLPVAAFSVPTLLCSRTYIEFTDNSTAGDTTSFSWFWTLGNPNDPENLSIEQNPLAYYDSAGPYNVLLRIQDSFGCKDSITNTINILPSPISSFLVDENLNDIAGKIRLTNTSTGATTYLWNFGNGKTSTKENPDVLTYEDNGTYIIRLIVKAVNKCTDTTSYKIEILFKGLYVPNALAPLTTDVGTMVFKPIGVGLKEYHVQVFDKWGHLLWESTKLDPGGKPGEYWNGTSQDGNLVPQGTYVWKIFASFIDGTIWQGSDNGKTKGIKKTMGTITLIR